MCINTNDATFTTPKKKQLEQTSGSAGLAKGLPHDKKNIIPKGKERTESWTSSKGKKGPSKHTCTPMSTEAPFPIAKTREQAKCPSAEAWIKRMRFICTGGHHTIIQENGIMNAAAARMDLEIIILSEGGQGKTNIV